VIRQPRHTRPFLVLRFRGKPFPIQLFDIASALNVKVAQQEGIRLMPMMLVAYFPQADRAIFPLVFE